MTVAVRERGEVDVKGRMCGVKRKRTLMKGIAMDLRGKIERERERERERESKKSFMCF